MNVWDIASLAGIARIAFGVLVLGLVVLWSSRHHRARPVRLRVRNRHDDH